MPDAYVQVATDGSGKRIDMELVSTLADGTIYRQRAAIVGDAADALLSIPILMAQQLAVLRQLAAMLDAETNSRISEDDFTNLT